MKTPTKTHLIIALALSAGAAGLSAKPSGSPGHLFNAVGHSVSAVGEASAAVAKGASGVVAVPVVASGAFAKGAGVAASAAAGALEKGGESAMHRGQKLWDFATGDASQRPAMSRERLLPPAQPKAPAEPDVSPREALKTKL